MTPTPSQPPTGDATRSPLAAAARQERTLTKLSRVTGGLWLWLGGVMGIILIDALWPLPAATRAMLALAAAGAGVAVMLRWRLAPGDEVAVMLRQASRLENVHGLDVNPLVNAIMLGRRATAGGDDDSSSSDLTAALTRRAVERGGSTLAQADVSAAVDRAPWRRERRRLLMVAGGLAALAVLWPTLILGGLARLADPWGDHPPFSLTRFAVVLPAPPHVGQDAVVRVVVAGELPEHLDFVALGADGNPVDSETASGAGGERWTMERIDAHHFERRLHGLRQAVTFRVEGNTGYSHRYSLGVLPAEAVAAVPETSEDTARPAHDPTSQPGQSMDSPTLGQELLNTAAAMAELGQSAREMNETATKLSQKIAGAPQAGGQPAQADVNKLGQAVDDFKRRAGELAAACRTLSRQSGPGGLSGADQNRMARAADVLDKLKVPEVGKGPPASGSGGPGDGAGQWADQAATAAQHDAAALQTQSQGVSQLAEGFQAAGPQQHTAGSPEVTTPSVVQLTQTPGTHETPEQQAYMMQAPQAYRDQVRQYFDRLNQNQSR